MLVGFAEGLGAAKTYAARNGYQVSPDKELIGLGAANLAAGLSSGMVVNGSLSKTAVNGSAGARTQASGLVVAVLTVITLLFLTGLFEDLPEATLAAVVIAALIELVDVEALAALYRAYSSWLGQIYGLAARADFIAAVAAMPGVLIFDTLPGLIIRVADSLLLLLYRVSRPHVAVLGEIPGSGGQWADTAVHPEDQTVPGVTVLRVESGMSFANADHVRAAIEDAAAVDGTRAVVLGALLLLVAARQFRGRPHGDQAPQMPKWMATIDKTTPPAAAGLAAVLSGANPKNLLLAVGGAATIAQTGIPAGQQAIAYLIFALIGTLGVGIPVVIYFAMGTRSEKLLAGLKDWMSAHNAVIMSVLCLIIAAKLIGDGISALA